MRYAGMLVVPAALCALSMFGGLAMAIALGLRGTGLLYIYADVSALATIFGLLMWAAVPWLRPREQWHLGPITAAITTLRERWLLMIIPLALLPIFSTGFTVMKTGVPLMTGFHFDGLWAEADALIFTTDPWRITHRFIGVEATAFLSFTYTAVWGVVVAFVGPIYTLSGDLTRVTRAFSALMATWLVGGIAGTALFSSVGPVFVDLVDPSLASRFAPLHTSLADLLPKEGMILRSQDYLRRSFGVLEVVKGGGVSAMPSMHLGVCAWLVLLSGSSHWRYPAIVLWVLIWIGSVHSGYHYALDGVVGSLIAWGCWKVCMVGAGQRRSQISAAVATA